MNRRATPLILLMLGCGAHLLASQQPRQPPPAEWCYAREGSLEVRAKAGDRKAPRLTLGHGALVPGFETKRAAGRAWIRVEAVDPASLQPTRGWVDSTRVEVMAGDAFPADQELLKLMGGAYLDDFTAAHTVLARYLVRQAGKDAALVCYAGGEILPQTRLQVFFRSQGKFSPGPHLERAFSALQSAIAEFATRDLTGDGNESLITREPFSAGPRDSGMNLVIRAITPGAFKILWEAPLELRNLTSYPPRLQVLAPAEKNIGAPGTVTKGEVEFRARGTLTDLVWKGQVEFYAVGREEPVETLPVEKVCAWDGAKFAPLR